MSVLVVERAPAQVMGDANYMPNPCVIVCPFAGPKCAHGIFRMNGGCKPSQLCTHAPTFPSHGTPRPCAMGPLNSTSREPPSVADGGTPWFADSHWQTMHKGNKAAEALEKRWRKAIKNKSLTRAPR